MFEMVKAIHEALHIESTWAFVTVIAVVFAIMSGSVAWVVDKGYKNSPEYRDQQISGPATTMPQPNAPKTTLPQADAPNKTAATRDVHRNQSNSPKDHPSEPADGKPPTLLDLFHKDMSSTLKVHDDAVSITGKDGTVLHIKRQVYFDFDANSKFVGFYISTTNPMSGAETASACLILDQNNAVQEALDNLSESLQVSGGYPNQMTNAHDLRFSGRVLIYHEAFLSITEKADVIRAYAVKHQDVQFRGPDYLGDQTIAWYHEHGIPKPK